MLSKNIPGAILICMMLFILIAFGFSLGVSIDWSLYLTILAIVVLIATLVGFAASGGD